MNNRVLVTIGNMPRHIPDYAIYMQAPPRVGDTLKLSVLMDGEDCATTIYVEIVAVVRFCPFSTTTGSFYYSEADHHNIYVKEVENPSERYSE